MEVTKWLKPSISVSRIDPALSTYRNAESCRSHGSFGFRTKCIAARVSLFDHLVGAHEKICRYFEPEGTGGSQVNH